MKMAVSSCIFLLFFIWVSNGQDSPMVTIRQGTLEGSWKTSYTGRKFASFEGVPYAKPPTGILRFKEPCFPEPWLNIRDAKAVGNACSQINRFLNYTVEGDEDCLFLNVYTANLNESAKLPVIFLIHGGAFMVGSGADSPPTFILDKDVVLVTINYRLNVFGFLSTEDEVVPGNLGLKDQTFAMLWVKNNIMQFGGDPESVTIAGSSSGGASVHYHYLSHLSTGLFHRGISWSGTSLYPWALTVNPLQKTLALARNVSCSHCDNALMVKCLQRRPASQLLQATTIFELWNVNLFSAFTPVVEPVEYEHAFINKLPYKALADGDFSQVPWMTSVTKDEGLYPAAAFSSDALLADLDSRWEYLAPYIFRFQDTIAETEYVEVSRRIKDYYLNGRNISSETFPELVEALTDRLFKVHSQKAALLQAQNNKEPVYFYKYGFRGPQSFSNVLSGTANNYGVCHLDDVFDLFGSPAFFNPALNNDTLEMNRLLLEIVYTFAVDGVPQLGPNSWDPVTSTEELTYLDLQAPFHYGMAVTKDLGHDEFWKTIAFREEENGVIN